MPVIRDLVVDIGLAIRRMTAIARGGRVLSPIPAQAAGRNPSVVRFAHPIEAKSRRAGGEGRNSESKLFWTPLPEPATVRGGRGMRDVTESCRARHPFKALAKARVFFIVRANAGLTPAGNKKPAIRAGLCDVGAAEKTCRSGQSSHAIMRSDRRLQIAFCLLPE